MYTILMKTDGSLICTTPEVKIRQTESMVDNMHFILPKRYKDIELSKYRICLKYINPANISKLEILTLYNENYKENFLEYRLPITTELTQFAGDISLFLTMTDYDSEIDTSYIAHSSEIVVAILPIKNYFTDTSSLFAIDKQILELQKLATAYDKTKADNIKSADGEIFLTANGEKIGDSVVVSGDSEVIELGGSDENQDESEKPTQGYEEVIEL